MRFSRNYRRCKCGKIKAEWRQNTDQHICTRSVKHLTDSTLTNRQPRHSNRNPIHSESLVTQGICASTNRSHFVQNLWKALLSAFRDEIRIEPPGWVWKKKRYSYAHWRDTLIQKSIRGNWTKRNQKKRGFNNKGGIWQFHFFILEFLTSHPNHHWFSIIDSGNPCDATIESEFSYNPIITDSSH